MTRLLIVLPVVAGYLFHVVAHLAGRPGAFQDDMRQHVLGLQPTHDLYGEYFAASVPIGVRALNAVVSPWCAPLDWARWGQPLLIGLLLAAASWSLGKVLFQRRGDRAENSALLLVWLVQALAWSADDLVSSTPRSWALLSLTLALAGAVRPAPLRVALALGLAAVTYPPLCPLIGILLLWVNRAPETRRVLPSVLAVAVVLGVVLVEKLGPGGEPTVTRRVAEQMAEFRTHGRAEYFNERAYDFWVTGSRSGFVTRDTEMAWLVLLVGGGVTLLRRGRRLGESFSRSEWQTLVLLFVSAVALYLLAHLLWFRMFHPNRHLQYAVTLLACVTLAAAFSTVRWWGVALLSGTLFTATVFSAGSSYQSGSEALRIGETLARSLSATNAPVVAAFPRSEIGSALPLLFRVPVVASIELSLPYHTAFYAKASDRIRATLDAWATDDPEALSAFLDRTGATHVLLEPGAWPLASNVGRDGARRFKYPKRVLNSPWQDYFTDRLTQSRGSLLQAVAGRLRLEQPTLLTRREVGSEVAAILQAREESQTQTHEP